MKLVCQRVNFAKLYVEEKLVSEIQKGFLVFVGVDIADTENSCEKLARKLAGLRIFEDENQKMNLSLSQVGGKILLVSNFTLCADCTHGFRPSFSNAQKGERAKELYEYFALLLSKNGVECKLGVFGADMKIVCENDGPINIVMDSNQI